MTESSSPTADADLVARLGRALAPAYEMDGELGRGGMAVVYRARDTRLKRGVAVKLLPPELAYRDDIRSRFLREAETAARLNHPNIVPIYTVDERDGLVYFVMALIRGGSVADRLARGEPFTAEETRRVMREVADALAYAHRAGVIHRDVKPDNILLDADSGRAMVTDFGIARAASDDADGARLTATGAVIGTPAYMSPEQCAGERAIDGRTDLYSLGTVAYQMLTRQAPFTGASAPAIMVKHVTERPVPVRERAPSVPEDLERIVMKLLEKDPANRFATGEELIAALDGAAFASPSPAAPARSSRDETLPKYVMDVTGIGGHAIPPLPERTPREERSARRAERRARSLPDRIRRFRGNLWTYGGTSAMLFGINMMTTGWHGHWWFLYPVLGMAVGLVSEMGAIVSRDGVPLKRLFFGPLPTASDALALASGPIQDDLLSSAQGGILRQAIADHQRIRELVARLSDTERRTLPDVEATANALFDRIEALARALHQLDAQGSPHERLVELDARIAELERSDDQSRQGQRKLGLLLRQREMLADLDRSRARLQEQYESAGLLLQNLSLDLLKVRSSGLDAALGGITSATQEARALSKEIGYVLEAAAELEDADRA